MTNIATIRQRLSETVRWCSSHATLEDPAGSTRHPGLMPPVFREIPERERTGELMHSEIQLKCVDFICEKRAALLEEKPGSVNSLRIASISDGRIIATEFNSDMCEFAESESRGFVDVEDIPGWDTWFHAEGGATYCWVPPQFIELANNAVQGVFDPILRWADEISPAELGPVIHQLLTEAGNIRKPL